MKKILAFAMAFALALTMGVVMTGCGSGSGADTEETTAQVTEETTQTDAADVDEAADASFEQFKQTMDDYEDFMNSYCDLVEEYNEDPNSVMGEYLEMTQKYVTVMDELDAIDEDELTDEELQYYLEVMSRINARLAEVAL